ncbi:protein fem-1 homolog C [Lepeophtheirus salmonis]|uniref:protein fem-1 homolog C n=1 Tax=Lepeophtheirus salmonis TaxID=72036 RepID=UPI001AE71AB6|nr:protein fem-1 homolog C-like [Lepeophtheirus salmonis]
MDFRNVVFNAARDGKLRRLKVFLDHRPFEEVKQLVSAQTNGATPLVLSCRNGHQEVVEYLVERCGANVEQPGSVTFDGETIEGAPPLWCAAAAGHAQIVKLLVQEGKANVNSTTKTNSTPLRAACFDGHYEIVKYLVEHGANIEVANRHGHTCLMIACYKGHLRIAKYLIAIGADVNRKSVKGNTALHDCAESGSLEIMKLLLDHGAIMDVDAYGMTPLLAASVTGHIHIVEYLISEPNLVSRQERIDALELLGATFVDKKRDMVGSYKLWKRAMEERYIGNQLVVPKCVVASPISAYENTVEVETIEQLEEIISDPDEMRMQALLVRERILGPAHPDTSYYIRYRGAVYADMGLFERCITLWMYALDMQQKMLEPLSPMTQSSLLSFAELFSFMMKETRNNANAANNNNQLRNGGHHSRAIAAAGINFINNNNNNNIRGSPPTSNEESSSSSSTSSPSENSPPFNFCDIMTVFNKAVKQVEMGLESMDLVNLERDITYFNRAIIIILHLVCLFTKLLSHLKESQIFDVKKAVYNFLKLGARGRNGATPLHLACTKDSTSVGRYPICTFPSLEAIQLLIECGADPNARDKDDNTTLHTAASAQNKVPKGNVIELLLRSGAHPDTVNKDGKVYSDLIYGPIYKVVSKPVKYVTLQCLAAKAVKKYNLHTDRSIISPDLQAFLDIH